MITVGGKEALFLACMALLNEGDEVLLALAVLGLVPGTGQLCGAKVVYVEGCESMSFKLTPEQIADAITPKTRVLIFNSPSNPGRIHLQPRGGQGDRGRSGQHEINTFSDEMYDRLVYGNQRFMSFAAAGPEAYARTLTFNAGSKTYAMTGWRVGYVAGPEPIIKAMAKLQSQTTSGTATFNQHALAEALNGDQSGVEMDAQGVRAAGGVHASAAERDQGVSCVQPNGCVLCLPQREPSLRDPRGQDSIAFSAKVLEQAHVALVPG
jgi:aspartate aminotransferase